MSVQSQIDRIEQNVANTYNALENVGADMPKSRNTDNLPETVISIKAVRYDGQTMTEAQKAQARRNIGVGLAMFISPDGSDSNDGLTADTPKKTVKACVNAGATRISAKRGIYNEAIDLRNIDDLEIFPTDNEKTYVAGEDRHPIVFDTSDILVVSAVASYNSIKRIAYSNAANAAYNAVFVNKTLDPTASASQSSYHAALWLFSDDEKTVCRKLKPVLTIAECEAEVNTFCYSGGYIYINADLTSVTKIVVPTITATGFHVNGANNLVLREVEVRFAGEYSFDLRSCAWVDLYKCASKYTTRASGFHPIDTNGVFRACYATKCFDGFAPNGHGHTTYTDCISEYNYDDGMSHHSGTEGTVIGGRYEGNGKGGNTPAYGAKVNIYGGLYKNNAQWGIGYVGSESAGYVSGMVQGAVMVDNPIGFVVQENCNVIAMNCVYKGNTNNKDAKGNLTEYDANFVKTVNGVEPDGNGNINVEGTEVAPAFTNVLKSAIDTDGSVFNGTGYKNGYRLNSSATEKEAAASGYTGFIKITPEQSNMIRMTNLELCADGHHYVHGFDASFARIGNALQNASINAKDENGVVTFEVYANWEYIRISTGLMNDETIITINQEIT